MRKKWLGRLSNHFMYVACYFESEDERTKAKETVLMKLKARFPHAAKDRVRVELRRPMQRIGIEAIAGYFRPTLFELYHHRRERIKRR